MYHREQSQDTGYFAFFKTLQTIKRCLLCKSSLQLLHKCLPSPGSLYHILHLNILKWAFHNIKLVMLSSNTFPQTQEAAHLPSSYRVPPGLYSTTLKVKPTDLNRGARIFFLMDFALLWKHSGSHLSFFNSSWKLQTPKLLNCSELFCFCNLFLHDNHSPSPLLRIVRFFGCLIFIWDILVICMKS